MKAVVFEGCAGWLHPAIDVAVQKTSNIGVILCNPYGHEALWAHRGIRTLAETLAAASIPTLRFDYYGTGDAIGTEDDGDMVERWLQSIERAAAYVRLATRVDCVILCGLRLGATLAAMAAQRIRYVGGVIMMAPVLNGKDYLRELQMVHRRWKNTLGHQFPAQSDNCGAHQPTPQVEAFGFRVSPETQKRLVGIDLAQIVPQQATHLHTLICDADKRPQNRLLDVLASLETQNGTAERIAFPDYNLVVCEEFSPRAHCATFTRIAEWIQQHFPADSQRQEIAQVRPSMMAAKHGRRPLIGDGYMEMPVFFDNGRLVGIYCMPLSSLNRLARVKPAPGLGSPLKPAAVIFPNTAANHHIGDARMWVTQARRLARQGVASLRMDISGLGDSTNSVMRCSETALHSSSGGEDVSKAVDWLHQRGHRRISLAGVCSGAYFSLHAALLNARVTGLVLVNQRVFAWEDSRHAPGGVFVVPTSVYLGSLRRLDKWKRLLTGQSHLATIVTVIAKRTAEKFKQRLVMWQNGESQTLNPAGSPVRAMIGALEQRGVRTHLVYGALDAGVEECETYFGPQFQWLQRCKNVSVSVEPLLDHALFLYPGREVVMTKVCEHFRGDGLRMPGGVAGAVGREAVAQVG